MGGASQLEWMQKLANFNEFKVGWLAGIIDGEGTIGFYVSAKGYVHASIAVVATSKRMIDEVAEILSVLGINHSKRYCGTPKGGTKPTWKVCVSSHTQLLALLGEIKDHLRVKNHEAEALYCYLSNPECHHKDKAEFAALIKRFKRIA